MDRYKTNMPFFKPGRVGPNYSEFLTFEGISVENGRNYYMNATHRELSPSPMSTAATSSR